MNCPICQSDMLPIHGFPGSWGCLDCGHNTGAYADHLENVKKRKEDEK